MSNNNKLKVVEDAHLLYLTTHIYLVSDRDIHIEFKLHNDNEEDVNLSFVSFEKLNTILFELYNTHKLMPQIRQKKLSYKVIFFVVVKMIL